MAAESHTDLEALLEELEAEEQAVSLQRRRLHDRLALYPSAAGSALEAKERELSARRRDLHRRIDALRAQRSAARGMD
jgi:hypothetical protein